MCLCHDLIHCAVAQINLGIDHQSLDLTWIAWIQHFVRACLFDVAQTESGTYQHDWYSQLLPAKRLANDSILFKCGLVIKKRQEDYLDIRVIYRDSMNHEGNWWIFFLQFYFSVRVFAWMEIWDYVDTNLRRSVLI